MPKKNFAAVSVFVLVALECGAARAQAVVDRGQIDGPEAEWVRTAAPASRVVAQIDKPQPAGGDGNVLAKSITPSSVETGQSPLDESFGPASHADWVRETRRKAWADTKVDLQVRSYYLDRDKYDDSQSQAWALGGSVGAKTGYFRERFALGATGYTSQRLYGPEDKDGTLLLKPGQQGYTVLGEAYGEFLFNQDTRLASGVVASTRPISTAATAA